MTSEEMNEIVSRLGMMIDTKLSKIENRFNQIEALATEANSIARGTAIQMAIMFGEMDKLAKRMDSLEVAALGRRQ